MDQEEGRRSGQPAGGLLGQLLQILSAGGLCTVADVARRMDVSEAMIAAMAENLTRRGYLTALDAGCTSMACGHCTLAGTCGPSHPATTSSPMLALTAKGRAAARG